MITEGRCFAIQLYSLYFLTQCSGSMHKPLPVMNSVWTCSFLTECMDGSVSSQILSLIYINFNQLETIIPGTIPHKRTSGFFMSALVYYVAFSRLNSIFNFTKSVKYLNNHHGNRFRVRLVGIQIS